MNDQLNKLYHGGTASRLKRLLDCNILTKEDYFELDATQPNHWPDYSNRWIENAIGYLPMPVGIIPNVKIDRTFFHVPMAIEETSVIAGIAKMSKWVNANGEISTTQGKNLLIGQIPFSGLRKNDHLTTLITQNRRRFIDEIHNTLIPRLYQRGGGVTDIRLKKLPSFCVVEVEMDVCDAMGANLMNQVLHWLKPKVEVLFQTPALMAILSNLQVYSLSNTIIKIYDTDRSKLERIVQAYQFAKEDPYRAATHNKGIFNGIDALCLSTGNDWRAVEAGGHAFASQTGHYQPLGKWVIEDDHLKGELSMPLQIGTVGGVTKTHPIATIALKLLGHPNANELRSIMLSIGLLQNLAALHALTGDGITKGHMKLHIENLLCNHTLNTMEHAQIKSQLEKMVLEGQTITQGTINHLLSQINETSK